MVLELLDEVKQIFARSIWCILTKKLNNVEVRKIDSIFAICLLEWKQITKTYSEFIDFQQFLFKLRRIHTARLLSIP